MFLRGTVATATGCTFADPGILLAQSPNDNQSPNEKLNIASIAVGGRGWSDVNGATQGQIWSLFVMS